MRLERFNAPLALVLAFNANVRGNLAFTLVALASITASVGLATSLEIVSRAMQIGVDRTTRALVGTARLEVVAGDAGVPESAVAVVASVPGVSAVSPLLTTTFQLEEPDAPLWILGIDLARERDVREYAVERNQVRIRDPLRLLAKPTSVIVSPALGELVSAGLGDSIPVRVAGKRRELVVEGVLREGGMADAFGGQVAVMDVYSLQVLIDRAGWFDRVDIDLEPGVELDDAMDQIQMALGGTATVRPPASFSGAAASIATSVRRGMLVISGIGAAVAALLCYSAISLAIGHRAEEFRLLRSVGVGAWFVRRTVWLDCLGLGLIGTVIGLVSGIYAAGGLVGISEVLPGLFGAGGLGPSDLSVVTPTFLTAVAVGLGATLAGALRSAEIAVSRSEMEQRSQESHPRTSYALLGISAMAVAASVLGGSMPPIVRIVLLFCGALGCVSASGIYLPSIRRAMRPVIESIALRIGALIGTSLVASARATTLTIGAVAAVVALMTVVSTLKESFAVSLEHIATSQYPDAVRVRAGTPFVPGPREPISLEVLERIRESHHVGDTVTWNYTSFLHQGQEVGLVVTQVVSGGRSWLAADEGASCETNRIASGEIAVSETFSRRFSVRFGSQLRLRTPTGERVFRVGCVFRAFDGPSGSVLLDADAYTAGWKVPLPLTLFVFPNSSEAEMITDLQQRTAGLQAVHFADLSTTRASIDRAVGRFDAMFLVVQVLALSMGAIAILNCLSGVVLERAIEFEVIRTTGASPGQLARLILADALMLSFCGLLVGIPLGWMLSGPLLEIMRVSFGWSIEFVMDLRSTVGLAIATAAMAATAGVYPVMRLRRQISSEAFAL